MTGKMLNLVLVGIVLTSNVVVLEGATLKSDREGRDAFPSRRSYVETGEGALQGKISKSRKGLTFYEFLGIPYGTVPQRFQDSEPNVGWEGLRDATQYSPPCFQINEYTKVVSGVEDCLFINVFTPQIPLNANNSQILPVIFAIYDGGFSQGDAKSLRPDYLMDHNVVLVTANYRLGPFGFLNAGVPSARGNQGFKDLVLALKWVQSNIQDFGGDPSKVVLNGGSNAAYAVSFLTLSPLTKGLFSGAISQSGSALCPWTQQTRPGLALENAQKLATAVDCPSSNPSYLVKCLQKIDAAMLVKPTVPVDPLYFDVGNPSFGPSVEEEGSDGAFLTRDPLQVLQTGNFHHVPYIIGVNAYEGSFFKAVIIPNDTAVQRLNNEWGRVAPNTLMYENFAQDPCKVSSAIRDFYFKGQPITSEDGEALSDVYGDRGSLQCVRDAAILYSKFAPVYLYNLTRAGLHSSNDIYAQGEKVSSPAHTDEMQYLFPSQMLPYVHTNSTDFPFSETLLQLWTSFAADGRPTCVNCNDKPWTPFKGDTSPLQWYELSDSPASRLEDPGVTSRMQFWQSLDLKGVISTVKPNVSLTRPPKTLFLPQEPETIVSTSASTQNLETQSSTHAPLAVKTTTIVTDKPIDSDPSTSYAFTTTTSKPTSQPSRPTTISSSASPSSTTLTTKSPTHQSINSTSDYRSAKVPTHPYNITTAFNFTVALKFSISPIQNGTTLIYTQK